MKRVLLALSLLLFFAAPAAAATWDHDVSTTVRYRLWIPDGVTTIRGIYLHFNESATDGRTYATKFRLQNWAKSMGFGIIGTYFSGTGDGDPTRMMDTAAAFVALAQKSGHPEVANAFVVADGLSLGGHNVVQWAARYPDRTIAYVSGASRSVISYPGGRFARTPGLYFIGDADPDMAAATKRQAQIAAYRQNGAQVAFFIQWGFGHAWGYGDDIEAKFFADVMRLRYPQGATALTDIADSCAWLADPTTWTSDLTYVAPYAWFTNPNQMFWLPSQDMAYVYRSHATRNHPLALSSSESEVSPGNVVNLSVSLTGATSVDLYNGAVPLAHDTTAPFGAAWTAPGPGPYVITAVGTTSTGQKTGYSSPITVLGSGTPWSVGTNVPCGSTPPPPPPNVDAGPPPCCPCP